MIDNEIRIGINLGKAAKKDRGITVYTRNLLAEMAKNCDPCSVTFLHYPESASDENFGFKNSRFISLPYSDKDGAAKTIVNEQILNPIVQANLGLDIVWHPHNRSQLYSPCAYVCTMHDILPIVRPDLAENYLNSFTKKLLYWSRTYSAVKADMVITVSEFSRQEIIKHLRVDPEKVVAIHLGINRETFHTDTNPENWNRVKSAYDLPEKYVLTTGSYAPHKNLKTIVEAYSHSNLPNENIGLVMVGPNDATGYCIGYQELVKFTQSLGGNNIRMLSSVSEKDLVTIYSHSHIHVNSSLYEGFGFTSLEAMACKVPVITSCLTALPEVCGEAAVYADPSSPDSFTEKMNILNENENLRNEQIEKGIRQVEKFTWEKCARETWKTLRDAVTSKKQKRTNNL